MKKRLSTTFLSIGLGLLLLSSVSLAAVPAANPPEPTYDTANVDGSDGEWAALRRSARGPI